MEDRTKFQDQAVELIENKQYQKLKALLVDREPADIAEVFEDLSKENCLLIYRLLPKDLAAEVFVEMDSENQANLINTFSDKEITDILEELYYDDSVDILEEMPANVVQRVLSNALPQTRKTINELLRYPEDSAGSIMTTEYVRLTSNMTVASALEFIRQVAIQKETIYTSYVTDANRHLIGIVTAKDLMTTDLDEGIGDIMDTNVISVSTTDDQEQIANMFSRYGYLALPVVDAENRLVGIITVDDAIDVIHEEAEEDFAKMAAITPSDREYLKTPAYRIWLTRIPWLLLLMISATFTGMIIASFEDALASSVILTAFIPMLMDTGGNSGSQASVTVIRGISLEQIEFSDIFKVLWKELRVALMCGISLAAVNFAKMFLIDKLMLGKDITVVIALVVSLTLCITVLCAKLIGSSLPILAKKIGFDPAVMASPFITTIVDAVSLLVYFNVAKMLLHI